MGDCSLFLLLGGVGWLENEGALGKENESGRVEELQSVSLDLVLGGI